MILTLKGSQNSSGHRVPNSTPTFPGGGLRFAATPGYSLATFGLRTL